MFRSILASLFICFLVAVQAQPVRAQSTLEYILLLTAVEGGALQQGDTPTVKASHLKYELVALDAQTHGKVTANTTQMTLLLYVTNDSPNYYHQVVFYPDVLTLLNPVNQAAVSFSNPNQPAPLTLSNVFPFSSFYLVLTNRPITLTSTNVFTNSLMAHNNVYAALFNYNSATPATPDGIVASSAENIIFEPSNNDLIPTIVNNQGSASNMLTNIENSLTGITTTVNNIWNRLLRFLRTPV